MLIAFACLQQSSFWCNVAVLLDRGTPITGRRSSSNPWYPAKILAGYHQHMLQYPSVLPGCKSSALISYIFQWNFKKTQKSSVFLLKFKKVWSLWESSTRLRKSSKNVWVLVQSSRLKFFRVWVLFQHSNSTWLDITIFEFCKGLIWMLR